MTDFIKFDIYEDYLTQNTERAQAIGKFHQREQEALKAHAELKAEYTKLITDSVASGKDATKQLDALDAKINDAEKTFIRRQREHAAARVVTPTGIKRTEVIEAQREYAAKVDKAHVAPFIAKMAEARAIIDEACDAYKAAETEYAGYFDEIKEVYKVAHENGETQYRLSQVNPFSKTSVQREAIKIGDTLNGKGVK